MYYNVYRSYTAGLDHLSDEEEVIIGPQLNKLSSLVEELSELRWAHEKGLTFLKDLRRKNPEYPEVSQMKAYCRTVYDKINAAKKAIEACRKLILVFREEKFKGITQGNVEKMSDDHDTQEKQWLFNNDSGRLPNNEIISVNPTTQGKYKVEHHDYRHLGPAFEFMGYDEEPSIKPPEREDLYISDRELSAYLYYEELEDFHDTYWVDENEVGDDEEEGNDDYDEEDYSSYEVDETGDSYFKTMSAFIDEGDQEQLDAQEKNDLEALSDKKKRWKLRKNRRTDRALTPERVQRLQKEKTLSKKYHDRKQVRTIKLEKAQQEMDAISNHREVLLSILPDDLDQPSEQQQKAA